MSNNEGVIFVPKPFSIRDFFDHQHNLRNYHANELTGLGAGVKKTHRIEEAGTFHRIVCKCYDSSGNLLTASEIKNDIEEIRVARNGNVFQEYSPAELEMMQLFKGSKDLISWVNGGFIINFIPRHIVNPTLKPNYAISSNDKVSITVDCSSGATKIARIEFRIWGESQSRASNFIYNIRQTNDNGILGEHTVKDFDYDQKSIMLALHIEEAGSSTIEEMSLQIGAVHLLEKTSVFENKTELLERGLDQQAGWYSIDFTGYGGFYQGFPMNVKTFKLRPKFATASPGQFKMIKEYVTAA